METTAITVATVVNTSIETAWRFWNEPAHITKWAFASDDWHAPYAENDLKIGGKFLTRMSAKDGSMSFDLVGTYTNVEEFGKIEYTLEDGRKVKIVFEKMDDATKVTETFDPENENPREMQQAGWQAILENFKKHVESN